MRYKAADRIFYFVVVPLIALLIAFISYMRLADSYELETLDLRFHLRPAPATTDKVVLIEIGDDTLKNLGQWPIARNYHALIIKALTESGAKSIIFDTFFSQPREGDDELESAIRDSGIVYLPFVFDLDAKRSGRYVSAKGYAAKNLLKFSMADKGEGHINLFPDIDGKFRRVPLLVNYEGSWYPYLSFLATCDYLGLSAKDSVIVPGSHISCANFKIPLDDRSNVIVNFSGKWSESYKHYSYSDIVQSYVAPAIGQKPILDLGIFKDKVCVIGLTATGTVDLHPNPFETLYPGFGMHAEIFNSILSKRFITRMSRPANLIVLALLSIIAAIFTLKTRPIKGLIILIFIEGLFLLAAVMVFNLWGLWIDLFYPAAVLVMLYMLLTLYKYVAEWKKRLIMESELGIAKRIQESFLPKSLPEIKGVDIEAAMFTARQVGGDLYDFIVFNNGTFGVMIGDVSGKGVPASLFMAMVTSEFKFFAVEGASPEKVLGGLNSKLVEQSSSNLFVTAMYLIFDMNGRALRFSNAGHLPIIHINNAGEVKLLDVPDGMPIGLVDSSYSGAELKFDKGDTFVLYTDGVTEAMNGKGELYGQGRLIDIIKRSRKLDSKGIVAAIDKDIRAFEPRPRQHDDITIIALRML